jgi:rhamnopyranosyl-N-acetylglucosaminyl-diphospho-decaprenol beta-1,3/1,4-galactofuranosyltransferase
VTDTVAAVVWTYNRFPVLEQTLRSVLAQDRQPDLVIVVDNDSPDDTVASTRRLFPQVIVHESGGNLGVGAAAAAGIEQAVALGADWIWLVEDDTPYPPEALGNGLRTAGDLWPCGAPGILGWQGVVLHWGTMRPIEGQRQQAVSTVDAVLLDGSLIHRRVVDAIGIPRTDYFMMIDDIEYSLRASRRGIPVRCTPAMAGNATRLTSQTAPVWRAYYQTRNHVRMVIEYRSPQLALGFVIRFSRQQLRCVTRGRAGRTEMRLRFRGLVDGIRGNMGKTLEPGAV